MILSIQLIQSEINCASSGIPAPLKTRCDASDEAVIKLHTANITASSRIATGEPEEALNKWHSRIRSLIIGSTTTAMIQSVKIPVLLYR